MDWIQIRFLWEKVQLHFMSRFICEKSSSHWRRGGIRLYWSTQSMLWILYCGGRLVQVDIDGDYICVHFPSDSGGALVPPGFGKETMVRSVQSILLYDIHFKRFNRIKLLFCWDWWWYGRARKFMDFPELRLMSRACKKADRTWCLWQRITTLTIFISKASWKGWWYVWNRETEETMEWCVRLFYSSGTTGEYKKRSCGVLEAEWICSWQTMAWWYNTNHLSQVYNMK